MKNEDGLIEQSCLFVVVGECVMPFTDLITDGLLSEAGSIFGYPSLCNYSVIEFFFIQSLLSAVPLGSV